MKLLRVLRWAAWAGVVLIAFLVAGVTAGWVKMEQLGGRELRSAASTGAPAIGGPFSLMNHRGERVTQDTFKGKPTAYFFGFTNCPEICPTTLFEMTEHLKALGPDADQLNVAFVTVDPERDTSDHLALYLQSFDPRIVGLTGTPDEVSAMARAFRIAVRKVSTEGGYTMDHTASVVVTDARGEFVTLIDYHEEPASALAKLRRAIRASSGAHLVPSRSELAVQSQDAIH